MLTPASSTVEGSASLSDPKVCRGAVTVGTEDGKPVQLAYTCYGQVEAPVHLLLIHGLFDDQRTWQYLLPHLRHDDRYMVTVDLLGTGLSSTPHLATTPATHRYDADLHVKQLRQLIAELSLRNLVLMGSSLGGGLALRMLCTPWPDRPAMVGLILEDAAAYPQQIPSLLRVFQGRLGSLITAPWSRRVLLSLGIAQWVIKRSIRRAFADPDAIPPGLWERYLSLLTSSQRIRAAQETARNMVPSNMDWIVDAYSSVAWPTLVCWGRQDRVISPLYAQRLAEDVPQSKLHLIDDCGHAPHLEKPRQLAQTIGEWLCEVGGETR